MWRSLGRGSSCYKGRIGALQQHRKSLKELADICRIYTGYIQLTLSLVVVSDDVIIQNGWISIVVERNRADYTDVAPVSHSRFPVSHSRFAKPTPDVSGCRSHQVWLPTTSPRLRLGSQVVR